MFLFPPIMPINVAQNLGPGVYQRNWPKAGAQKHKQYVCAQSAAPFVVTGHLKTPDLLGHHEGLIEFLGNYFPLSPKAPEDCKFKKQTKPAKENQCQFNLCNISLSHFDEEFLKKDIFPYFGIQYATGGQLREIHVQILPTPPHLCTSLFLH